MITMVQRCTMLIDAIEVSTDIIEKSMLCGGLYRFIMILNKEVDRIERYNRYNNKGDE